MEKTPHILFVDDDEDIISVQQQMLAHFEYKVSAFTYPIDALEHFRSDPKSFDAAIVDLTMPLMNGDQLACEIKQLNPNLPVILCTGFGAGIAQERVCELAFRY
jgi:DNA-binding NtrC family response regulator